MNVFALGGGLFRFLQSCAERKGKCSAKEAYFLHVFARFKSI